MQRIRCAKCGATLFFQDIQNGVVEIMCRITKCKTITRIECKNGELESFDKNCNKKNCRVVE